MAHGEVQPVDGRVLGERGQGRLEVADRGRRGGDHLPRTEPDAGETAAATQRAGDDASREQAEATDNDGGQFAVTSLLIEVSCSRIRRFKMVPVALIAERLEISLDGESVISSSVAELCAAYENALESALRADAELVAG